MLQHLIPYITHVYGVPTNHPQVDTNGSTSVASFLVLGGGGQDPKMYRQEKKVTDMRERAKRASASETYIFRTPNTSARTINAVLFYYLWHGAV